MLSTGYLSAKSNSVTLGSIFELLKVGQSSLTVTLSTKSFTRCLATSINTSSSNSTFITDIPSYELDLSSTRPLTPFISSSNGLVTSFSISSALFPGKTVATKTFVVFISGNGSLGIVLYAVIPEIRKITIKIYIMVLFSIAQLERKNSLFFLFILFD